MANGEADRSRADYLERQYNNRLSIPDAVDYNTRAVEASDEARRRLRCSLDVPYGISMRERLDVFFGEGSAPRPLLFFVHGGYWRSRDKSEFSFISKPFVDAGVTVVLPTYDLAPSVTVAHIVEQIRAAFEFVRRNVHDLGIDPSRMHVAGHSAGAHLAVMLLARRRGVHVHDSSAQAIRGVFGLSGIYDLMPLLETSFNRDIRLDAEAARAVSPVNFEPSGPRPLYTAVGALESDEFKRQAHAICNAWPGCHAGHIEVPGCHHLSILEALADSRSLLFQKVLNMVES